MSGRHTGSRVKQYAVRICLLGEAGSGKSSLFYRVKHKAFRDSPEEQDRIHTTSQGPNSRTRFYDSYSTVRRPDYRTKINLTLMDTGSRERYQSLTAQYYNRANVIVLVCSLDSEHTLTCLNKWYAEAQYYIDNSNIIYSILATKSDLPKTEREVTIDQLRDMAAHLGISEDCVFEVSSATGEGVDEAVGLLCEAVVGQFNRQSSAGVPNEVSALLSSGHTASDSVAPNYLLDNRTPKERTCCSCFPSKQNPDRSCTIL